MGVDALCAFGVQLHTSVAQNISRAIPYLGRTFPHALHCFL